MKKEYQTPKMNEVQMKRQKSLLMGSVPVYHGTLGMDSLTQPSDDIKV